MFALIRFLPCRSASLAGSLRQALPGLAYVLALADFLQLLSRELPLRDSGISMRVLMRVPMLLTRKTTAVSSVVKSNTVGRVQIR